MQTGFSDIPLSEVLPSIFLRSKGFVTNSKYTKIN